MASKTIKSHWFDLQATDMVDTRSFYEGLFGWTFLRLQDDALSDYWVIQTGEEMIGGLRKAEPEKRGLAAPVIYFTVDDLIAYSQRVTELGGRLVGQRVDLGKNRGSYQWFRDREENLLALWSNPPQEKI